VLITYGKRLYSVIGGLPSPNIKLPIIFFFLGKRKKVCALQNIFPNNNIIRRKAYGIAVLYLNTTTSRSDYSFLFADYNPDTEILNQIEEWDNYHKNIRYRVNVKDEEATATFKKLVNKIHSRLLLNFVNVIYLFADDLKGPEAVVHRLIR
jgi:hypothetical protein